jgi:hypothetical protein
VQTLIHLTPEAKKQNIESDITGKFKALESVNPAKETEEMTWFAFQYDAIFGAQRELDLTDASQDELYKLLPTVTPSGMMKVGQRGKQTIYISRKVLAKKATVRELITRMKKHAGRLKAAWLPAWRKLGAPTGVYAPRKQELDNEDGAKGSADWTADSPGLSEFEMMNFAVGAGSNKLKPIVANALRGRSEAMAKYTEKLLQNPELLKTEAER